MIRLFRHYFSTAWVALGVFESLLFFGSVYAAAALPRFWQHSEIGLTGQPLALTALVFAAALMVSVTATGLYQRSLRDSVVGMAARMAVGFVLGFTLLSLGFMAVPVPLAESTVRIAMLLSIIGIAVTRGIFQQISDRCWLKPQVLVLGTGRQAAQIQRLKRKVDWSGVCLVGYVPLPGQDSVVNSRKVMSITTSLPDLAEQHAVDQLVIAADDCELDSLIGEILECKLRGIEVIDLLRFMERQTHKIQLEALGPLGITYLDGFSHAVLRRKKKRVFDILVSIMMLLVMLPVIVGTALAVLVESRGRGPILYFQNRVGRDGRIVRLMKFRSMRTDAEKDGKAVWASTKDDRVTRVGKFIRRTRIDELPQLLNVLKGDMSFVGPRPERPEFVEHLSKTIPYYAMRHRINPGITGWAQINYPYGCSDNDAKEKLQYDLYYMKNYSLLLDIIIMLETAQVVLWAKGSR